MKDDDRMNSLQVAEYQTLRATIQQRGTARLSLALLTFVAWAGLAVAIHVLAAAPILSLMSLTVLAAGFETVFALHVGVERIGRYLQVYYEVPDVPPAWEHVAMLGGARLPRPPGGLDPLFGGLFLLAVVLNFLPVALAAEPIEGIVLGLFHGGVVTRIVVSHRFAASQRARDLEALTEMRANPRS